MYRNPVEIIFLESKIIVENVSCIMHLLTRAKWTRIGWRKRKRCLMFPRCSIIVLQFEFNITTKIKGNNNNGFQLSTQCNILFHQTLGYFFLARKKKDYYVMLEFKKGKTLHIWRCCYFFTLIAVICLFSSLYTFWIKNGL